jgi:ATP-dependent helicase/nuclease subunit B
MSASKFDTFNRCRFSFFLKYGLSAKKIQPAEFDVLQRGTIVHYVLERFITDYKENYSGLSDNELDILTDKYIEEYLGLVAGFENIRNTRIEFLISRISRSLKDVVRHVCAELSQSLFEPKKCELKIGNGEEIETVKFPFDNGEISLVGSIDRVDEYNGYIRIIDYKTGSKSFKLPDILFGLNLQMLIYLYAVTRGNGLDDSAAAGILYQPSSRDIKDEGLAMNGLLPADIDLIKAMDKNISGEFVPKPYILKDNSISKRGSYIDASNFTEIFDYIEKLMKKTGNLITSGDIRISPLDGRESPACKYCDFASVCRIENKSVPRVENYSNEKVFEIMKEAETNGI